MSVADSSFPSILREARQRKKLTQVQLADALGVSQSGVAQWESGRSFPSKHLVPQIEKLLGIKVETEARGRRSTREITEAAFQRFLLPITGVPISGNPELVLLDGLAHGQVPAPPQLEAIHGAAAVYVRGQSMEPRYFPGELVYLHPDKPPNPGYFVFVTFNEPGFASPVGYIRQYLAQDLTHIHLRTLNPRKDHVLASDVFVRMSTIVGSGLF